MLSNIFRTVLCAFFMLSAVSASAQSDKTILVLDASGSMWGQIDGVAKITIAQEVVGNLLQSIPDDQALGLTAYGHNRKGDCSDIETLVEPALGNREAIAAAVNGISPKGKTPLSEAVLKAADVLKYEENKATVILISDGVETCDFDPCAIGTQLEESGVDFTAHVVGFDVAAADQVGLRCLAENTGGQFLSAANADELGAALETVAAAPPPPPAPIPVRFYAAEEGTDITLTENLIWTLSELGSDGPIRDKEAAAEITEPLQSGGNYLIEVLRTTDEATASLEVAFAEDMPTVQVLYLPKVQQFASISAAETAPAASMLAVEWEGPAAENDYIAVTTAESQPFQTIYSVKVETGNPVKLLMPGIVGTYELRYVLANGIMNGDDEVLATQTIEVTPHDVTVSAPETAGVGDTIVVDWEGPGYDGDYISVSAAGEDPWQRVYATAIKDDGPVQLLMPGEPGDYEIRYVLAVGILNGDDVVLATQSITVTEQTASITAPDVAKVGEVIVVDWSGPASPGDYISVSSAGEDPWRRFYATAIKDDGPLQLQMPGDPGEYELRYVLALSGSNGDDEVLATRPITLEEQSASVTAPATALAGEVIVVDWVGPAQQGDYISVSVAGEDPWKRFYASAIKDDGPVQLQMPGDPGEYEIRYVLALSGSNGDDEVIATQSITLEAQTATLTAPATALAGETIVIDWVGPLANGDYISVAPADAKNWQRVYAVRPADTGPVQLLMPGKAGTYELRYVLALSGSNGDDEVIGRTTITIEEHDAALDAPDTVAPGADIPVSWTGPSYAGDYVAISERGSKPWERITALGTETGNPVSLKAPDQPGTYELRYVLALSNSNGDNVVIVRKNIEVK